MLYPLPSFSLLPSFLLSLSLLFLSHPLQRSLAEVVVYCAPHDCSQPGQMEIYEEINKTYQKPKKIISLIDINQPGVQTGSPCTSLSSSPGNAVIFGTSPSSNGISLHPFQLVLRTGEVFEFFAESPEDQRQWVKRLGLLLMFPHSPIPEEPTNSPIKDTFRARLNPADYKAGESGRGLTIMTSWLCIIIFVVTISLFLSLTRFFIILINSLRSVLYKSTFLSIQLIPCCSMHLLRVIICVYVCMRLWLLLK